MRSFKQVLTYMAIICTASIVFASSTAQYAKAQKYFETRQEVYFKFSVNSPSELKYYDLGNIVSLDRADYPEIYAYANKDEFEKFVKTDLNYEILTPPSLEAPVTMSDYKEYFAGVRGPMDWYAYPTYSAYVGFLNKWVADYPNICKLYDLGPSGMNTHRIYCLKISDNVTKNEAEPMYLETNTIHGDETLNFMDCLHMIDTMLTQYGKDTRITKLVDNLQMYFIPNINPDATYKGGDNTVSGAQRANVKNGWDLNRNYKCSCPLGPTTHKYGLFSSSSAETQAVMNIQNMFKFNLAEDQHGGTETILYPYGGISSMPWDHNWYRWACSTMVVQIHKDCGDNGYMTSGLLNNKPKGWGNVYGMLYECHGIRCDYNHFWGSGKSITIESSVTKNLPASELKKHWGYLKEALFQSYEWLYFGIQGTVTNSKTNAPINMVNVKCNGDVTGQDVYTDSAGYYVKFTIPKTFTITFSAAGYIDKVVSNFVVDAYAKKYPLDVKLDPVGSGVTNTTSLNKMGISIVPLSRGIRINTNGNNVQIGIYAVTGKLIKTLLANNMNSIVWDAKDMNGNTVGNGCYVAKINTGNMNYTENFILGR